MKPIVPIALQPRSSQGQGGRLRRLRRIALTLGFLVIGLPAATSAQERMTIEVLNHGKPVANVEIVDILNQGKPIATTGATGQVAFDMNLLNFGKGETVEVWIKQCEDGKVQIVLASVGSDDPCTDRDAAAGERCGCRRIGAFIWGGGPVTIDIGTGQVTQARSAGGAEASSLILGGGLDIRQMLNLEDVVSQVPGGSNASATGWAPGVQLFAEWLHRRIFAIGLDAGYSRMETELAFPSGVQTGDLDYYEAGVNAKLGIPTTGRFWPYATVGLYRTWNKADFRLDGLSEHRVHKTRRDGFGAGFDYYPHPHWGMRLEGLYSSTFEDDDADEHLRWKLALLYRRTLREAGL